MLSWQTGLWGCAAPIFFLLSPCRVGRAPWFVAVRVVMVFEGVGAVDGVVPVRVQKAQATTLLVVRVGLGGSRAGIRGSSSDMGVHLLAVVRGKVEWMVQWRWVAVDGFSRVRCVLVTVRQGWGGVVQLMAAAAQAQAGRELGPGLWRVSSGDSGQVWVQGAGSGWGADSGRGCGVGQAQIQDERGTRAQARAEGRTRAGAVARRLCSSWRRWCALARRGWSRAELRERDGNGASRTFLLG